VVRLDNSHIAVERHQTHGCWCNVGNERINKTEHLVRFRINTADVNGISTVAHSKSLTAKAMMYSFVLAIPARTSWTQTCCAI